MTHARSNYEEEVRVPLLMIWDDRLPEGRRVRHPAQLADVLPTLTSLLGIEADAFELDGTDLLPYVRGAHEADPDRPIFLERPYYPAGRPAFAQKGHGYAVRTGRWKLFEAPDEDRVELYDLEADPGERRDRSAAEPEQVERLSAMLADWRRRQEARAGAPRDLTIPEDARDGLRALGYADDTEPPAR